jgi:hypothetical protein
VEATLSTTEQKNIKTKLDAAAVIEKQAQAAKDYAEALTLATAEQEQFDREWDAIMDKGKGPPHGPAGPDRRVHSRERDHRQRQPRARAAQPRSAEGARPARRGEREHARWHHGQVRRIEGARRPARHAMQQQLTLWNQVGDAAGNFFSDLVMHGKSAFDNLRQYVKQLLADMISLFAKRWVLQLAAGGGRRRGTGAHRLDRQLRPAGLVTSVGRQLARGGISGGSGVY